MSKILLIEDDEVMSTIVKRILQKAAYQVDHVRNGKEAFEILEKTGFGFDLIITDIMMPYANGFEILSRVRNLPGGRKLPVILLSNAGVDDMINEGLKLGADDFLKKPVLPAELLMRIRRLLNEEAT
ncbi:PleD family two-component system response regulator [Chitinophaga sp. GCM10012297]|uniref:Response regulator transcription factor n=1 Tax=Chitinophaga chungangae TaxID=2821488 RepID=A0ABS3YCH4_9BACT|nr:response regulator transcription factor [Chitinophaga chungangae]MBO9152387.1 response regulator transcription factor [Chitinophaga chungangae]